MMPLWIRILGSTLIEAVNPRNAAIVQIPYGKMVTSLICLILPILIGLLIAKCRPKWAEKMRKVDRIF
jgi:predicted Na+-dependent transporter